MRFGIWTILTALVFCTAAARADVPADSPGPPSRKAPAAAESRAEAALRDGVPTFLLDGRPVARLARPDGQTVSVFQMYRDNRNLAVPLRAVGGRMSGVEVFARYEGQGWVLEERVVRLGPRLFRVQRTWRNQTGKEQNAILVCELERPGPADFYVIPGISYNGNRRWPRAAFQGTAAGMDSREAAESISGAQWLVAGDRVSVPACTTSEGDGAVVGLFAEAGDASFSACSVEPGPEKFVQRLWWPQQEQPYVITGTGRAVQAPWETVFLWPGDAETRSFYVVVGAPPAPRYGFRLVLDEAWALFKHPVRPRQDPRALWELGIRYAKESLWTESPRFTGFFFSLEPKDGGFQPATWPWRFELGFVGQAAGLGVFMLEDFLRSGNEDSWAKGKAALDHWAAEGKLPGGLLVARFDDRLAWKDDPDVDVRNMGDGAYFYLLAAGIADKARRPQPNWRATGLGICDFFLAHALPDGRFGKKWKASGTLVDAAGTIGAYLLPALIEAHRQTGKPAYLAAAARAFRAYADDDLEAVCLTAGAIDQDTIDKETGYPLLDAGLALHGLTGDRYYLEKAEKAAAYLASWQYHYSLDFPAGSPAASIGYDSFGGTSVSVGGGGADQGGAVIALGWLGLAKATGNGIWRERALAAWAHTSTGVSDGALRLNGKLLPAGAQWEGFQHSRTRKSYGNRQGFGTEWLCAWCTAFRLWTLQRWPDWQDFGPGR